MFGVSMWRRLWRDEGGFVVSAETALLGTLGIVGVGVGVNCAREALDAEFHDLARAFRSLDQSYAYTGSWYTGAYVAGSAYTNVEVVECVPVPADPCEECPASPDPAAPAHPAVPPTPGAGPTPSIRPIPAVPPVPRAAPKKSIRWDGPVPQRGTVPPATTY
jgi:hypothetical protein